MQLLRAHFYPDGCFGGFFQAFRRFYLDLASVRNGFLQIEFYIDIR